MKLHRDLGVSQCYSPLYFGKSCVFFRVISDINALIRRSADP